MRVTAAPRGVTVARIPAGTGVAPLANVPDRQRRDSPPELVVGCKHPVIPVPVLPRRRDEIESRSRAKGGRAQYRSKCSRL